VYDYHLDGTVAVLTMRNGENRFNSASVQAFTALLEEIVSQTEVNALVVTSAHEKVWCNGIDLEWLFGAVQTTGEIALNHFLVELYSLFRRLLTMPMPTIAAMNGHAFAGGAFLAFAHDFRFMRSDRGWLCMPEVDLGIPLGPVFLALSKRVVPMPLLEEMQYTARRMTAEECLERHIITRATSQAALLEEAVAFARGLNKKRDIVEKMKLETLAPILKVIDRTLQDLALNKPGAV